MASNSAKGSTLDDNLNMEAGMWLIFVEATGAFLVFALIIWWTMFSSPKPPSVTDEDE